MYSKIEQKVDVMINQGLIEEVKKITNEYDNFPTAMQSLGYKEVIEYFNGKYTKEQMIEKVKQETRRYAKRQITWFKKNEQTVWISGESGVDKNIEIIMKEL